MEFRFTNASCVAVGSFNVYIIQPAWLIEEGILPTDLDEVAIEVNLAQPGFRIRCPSDAMTWSVQPTRIAIETDKKGADCGKLMALVLKNLPHTPLRAIGNNARYSAPLEDSESVFGRLPDYSGILTPEKTFEQQTLHFGIREGEQLFNLSVFKRSDSVQLSLNVHTEVSGKKSPFAQQVADDFVKHLKTAEEMVSNLFQVSIIHDSADNQS